MMYASRKTVRNISYPFSPFQHISAMCVGHSGQKRAFFSHLFGPLFGLMGHFGMRDFQTFREENLQCRSMTYVWNGS